MTIAKIIEALEQLAPPVYQESYDNTGVLTGSVHVNCTGALIALDATEEVIDEALKHNCNLVIAHHPIIFSGLKSLSGKNYIERTIIKALKNDICIYAIHTNLDNVFGGVSFEMGQRLGLKKMRVLKPSTGNLAKLVTYVPQSHQQVVMDSLFSAGAGKIGNYEDCSFLTPGTGTFKPVNQANPFSGTLNQRSHEAEFKMEFLIPVHKASSMLNTLRNAHPYEEVAYEIIPLLNQNQQIGSGVFGEFEIPLSPEDLMTRVKVVFGGMIRFTLPPVTKIKSLALCGGSGSFLLEKAIAEKADAFLSSDFKYHQFFDAPGRIFLMDIGHYEGEQFTVNLIHDFLIEKFPNFAARQSERSTNPVHYF